MGKLVLKKERTKEGFLLLISAIFSILGLNFIQAYSSSGFLGFPMSDVFFAVIFVVIFFIINIAFSRFFRDSEGRPMKTAWVPSLALAFGATYGLWTTGFDLGDLLFNLGISGGFLDVLAPILLVGFLIFLIIKLGFSNLFFILGGGFVLVGITGIVYRIWWSIFIGVVLLVIGIIIKRRSNTFGKRKDFKWFKKKERFKNKLGKKGGGNNGGGEKENVKVLKKLAKRFKRWAKKTKNPQFYGSWANFVNYLKKGGYGNSENDIADNFGIKVKKFVKIFNRYGKP